MLGRHVIRFGEIELSATERGVETTKTSTDKTTTARTKRKTHIVHYRNNTDGSTDQRYLDASTSGGKSETSSSPTGLDADPWASSWVEVRRRISLNEEVEGSPFTSTTPDCSSSGNGHMCSGGSTTPTPPQTVYCRRGAGCQNPPGVEGNREAHLIKCPERTYKQGAWSWLLIKIKEACRGEKWSCHSEADNCTRKHLHIKTTPESSESGSVINGVFVPAGYSVGACGEHMYASDVSSASHHSLQASCPTDSRCISTNFYQCQHTEHEYPPETRVRCGNPGTGDWGCSEGGYAESTYAHILYCDAGHRFWGCHAGKLAFHRAHGLSMSIHDDTTSGNEDNNSSNENDSGVSEDDNGGNEDESDGETVLVACGNTATGANACSSGGLVPQSNTHRATCRAEHTYWGCNLGEAADHSRHAPNMICGNTATSSSGRCSYNRVASSASEHQSTCAAGHTYWSCSSSETTTHRSHTASAPSGNSDDDSDTTTDNNENPGNTETNTAPSAPSIPTVVCPANEWTNCGGTVSHATTCGRDHPYYTCNPNAVSYHSWH